MVQWDCWVQHVGKSGILSAFIQKLITLNIQQVNKDFPLVLVGLGYFAIWMPNWSLFQSQNAGIENVNKVFINKFMTKKTKKQKQ